MSHFIVSQGLPCEHCDLSMSVNSDLHQHSVNYVTLALSLSARIYTVVGILLQTTVYSYTPEVNASSQDQKVKYLLPKRM